MQQHRCLGRVDAGGLGILQDDRAVSVDDKEGLPVTLLAVPDDRSVPLQQVLTRTLRVPLARPRHLTAAQAGYTTSGFIALGILIAIITTPDPTWWQLHFSRLGTFAVFSGYMFNATIVVSGALVVYFATRLRVEMARHAGSAVLANRRAATFVPVLVGVIGVHLSIVGIFPMNVNEFMHDRGPQGALLAFVVILGSRRWVLKGMHPSVAKTTRRVGLSLTVTIPAFVAGFLNLAAFELIVFSLMFLWFLMLARNIGRPAPSVARASVIHTRPRRYVRVRRHVGLHSSPPQALRTVSAHSGYANVGATVSGMPLTGALARTHHPARLRTRSRRSPNRSFAAASDSDHHHAGT